MPKKTLADALARRETMYCQRVSLNRGLPRVGEWAAQVLEPNNHTELMAR